MKLFRNLFRKKERKEPETAVVEDKASVSEGHESAIEEPAQSDDPSGSLLDMFNQLQRQAEKAPEDTDILIRMAEIACQLKDYVGMQDACEKAIVVDNRLLRAYHLYAQACSAQQNVINAIAMTTKAIMLLEEQETDYPQSAELYQLRGQQLMLVGDKVGAEADMKKMFQLDPSTARQVSGDFEAEGKD